MLPARQPDCPFLELELAELRLQLDSGIAGPVIVRIGVARQWIAPLDQASRDDAVKRSPIVELLADQSLELRDCFGGRGIMEAEGDLSRNRLYLGASFCLC